MIPTQQLRTFAQWTTLGAFVGVACGLASAALLTLLELVTDFRGTHEWLVYALPLAGLGIGAIYERWGAAIKGGNNLIIDTIHENAAQIPLRMAPMVLLGTVLTHLLRQRGPGRNGGADGRQRGADAIAHRFRVSPDSATNRIRSPPASRVASPRCSGPRSPVSSSVSKSSTIGRIEYDAPFPALVAGRRRRSDHAGARHCASPLIRLRGRSLFLSVSAVSWCSSLARWRWRRSSSSTLTHFVKARMERHVPRLPIRMFLGGAAVVGMWRLVGSSDYLGLGIPTILRAFSDPHLPAYAVCRQDSLHGGDAGVRLSRRGGHAAVLHRRRVRQCPRAFGRGSNRAWRGGRSRRRLWRRREYAARPLHHGGRAGGRRDPSLRRHRDGHRVSTVGTSRNLPGATFDPEETWTGSSNARIPLREYRG